MRRNLPIVAVAAMALAAAIAGGWIAGRRSVSLDEAAVSLGLALPGLETIETRLHDWTYPGADLLMSLAGISSVDRSPTFRYGASYAMSTSEDFDAVVGRYRGMLERAAKARSTKNAIPTVATAASAGGSSTATTRLENGILIFANTESCGSGAGNSRRACLGLRSRNARIDLFIGRGEGDSRTRITVIHDDVEAN
jgi:hypothetical protein